MFVIINICMIWKTNALTSVPCLEVKYWLWHVYLYQIKACQHLWLIKAFCLVFSAWSSLSETLKVVGSINRCYPLTLENMVEGPDVRVTSQPWDQLMWQWWRWVLAEETDLVASEVPIFPAFFCVGLNPPNWAILEGRERWRTDEEKYVNTEEKERQREGREDWSVVLTVVTDVEFSTKLCQKPSCQS